MEKGNFKDEIKKNLVSSPLQFESIEQDVIEVLLKLLDLFYSVLNSEAQNFENKELSELFSDNKLKV